MNLDHSDTYCLSNSRVLDRSGAADMLALASVVRRDAQSHQVSPGAALMTSQGEVREKLQAFS
jgi:hypothetical protein